MDIHLPGLDLPPDGDREHRIDGAQEAAQDVLLTLDTPIGSLPWDRAAGSSFPSFLNGITSPERIQDEMRRVALGIDGIIASSIITSYDARRDAYRLTFTHESSAIPVSVEAVGP